MKSVFNSRSVSSTLLPRQGYGMDFYGVFKGEILVIVDLATRETILRFLPDQKQEKVAKVVMNAIVYNRGVPDFIRSDNAPQLMQGACRDVCTYLGIQQIVTGGHNPRGNSICERVNQTIGSFIRKMSDKDYKDLKHLLPAFEHAINCTYNSSIGCTPFEAGHGLAARSIAEARRAPKAARGTDPDMLEDVSSSFDESSLKLQIELAARLMDDARSTSEWHRRMTSKRLNQSGREIDLSKMKAGTNVYFYKPPTVQDAERLTKKAKHIDHYVGPGKITGQIGDRSFWIEYTNKRTGKTHAFQRDAGMILLEKPLISDRDPSSIVRSSKAPSRQIDDSIPAEGEFVILQDEVNADSWYVAQVTEVLPDRVKVNLYTTLTQQLDNHKKASKADRLSRLEDATFLRTWCLDNGRGEATTKPPIKSVRRAKDLWTYKFWKSEIKELVLIRNVGLTGSGKLDQKTAQIASTLIIPHHVGAGGEDDFEDVHEQVDNAARKALFTPRRSSRIN
jgi:hypothetical protein